MSVKKKTIQCCGGKYHVLVNKKYYCMAPPDIECAQLRKDTGKFTKGEKKIYYCVHHQTPCSQCQESFDKASDLCPQKE